MCVSIINRAVRALEEKWITRWPFLICIHCCTSALLNMAQACPTTPLCSAWTLPARNTAPDNKYCSLPRTTFPGTKGKSAQSKFTRKANVFKEASWLFTCHREDPTGKKSSPVIGPVKVYNSFFLEKFARVNRSLPQYEANFRVEGMCLHWCSGSFYIFINNRSQLICFLLG